MTKKLKQISTHQFVRHTRKYLKLSERTGGLIITHYNHPRLAVTPIKAKTIHDLQGLAGEIKVYGDINEPILPRHDE